MQYAFDIDHNRKRFFFSFCTAMVIVTFPLLFGINYMEGDSHEMIIDLLVILLMAGSLIIIKISSLDAIIYRGNLFLLSLILIHSVFIGAGEGTALYWAFTIPPLFFYFFGKKEGSIWAGLFYLGLWGIMLSPAPFHSYAYDNMTILRFLITFLFIAVIAYGLESSRYTFSKLLDKKNNELLGEKERLEQALSEIKTLRGFIPICSNCKKIRNDTGYWEQIETYITKHSEANFSHSLCPDCVLVLYPDIYAKLKSRKP